MARGKPTTNAARRRSKRGPKPPRGVAVERVVTERPAQADNGNGAAHTALTARERRRLAAQVEALAGGIDLDLMGVRYLELRYCGWAPDQLAADPACAALPKPRRAGWVDRHFRAAAAWWAGLHPATRGHLIELTRACAAADPVTGGGD